MSTTPAAFTPAPFTPAPFPVTLSDRVIGAAARSATDASTHASATTSPSTMPSLADIDEPLRLPDAAAPPRRGSLPLVASLVPLVGAVALWLVTGSMFMLWFAALSPLIAVATMLDGRRAAKRDRERHRVEAQGAQARIGKLVDERHDRERHRLWAEHPDVVAAISDGVIWTGTGERRGTIVVGTGRRPSAVRVSGGEGDADAAPLRARATVLDDAPVTVPVGIGVAVMGPAPVAAAVVRALAAQVLVASAPGVVRVIGDPRDETQWLLEVPHRRATEGMSLTVCAPGDAIPDAEIVIVRVVDGQPIPPRCGAVLRLIGIDRARLAVGADTMELGVEAISIGQARTLMADLDARAAALFTQTAPSEASLADLLQDDQRHDGAVRGYPGRESSDERAPRNIHDLAAVVGTAGRAPFVIDLVADGPHAVVVGMTGAGKSELLISWVTSLCATHTPADVSFLLADFKGGTAFDALSVLPHVTGVITDLDGSGARRALQSLSAELRWREAQLVQCGARDIRDDRVRMPRLVVIVDEFAALLAEHPELQAVFTDVAARGRALGMHLVLGTQRAAGVLRDALLANCPLRVCLRVTDPIDSRFVIGTDEAAALPGGLAGRGRALIRRAGDAAPAEVRIGRAEPALIAEVAARHGHLDAPRRPWLPELPTRLNLADIPAVRPDEITLGLADEPENQRQVPVVLKDGGLFVVGRSGSGRTTALTLIALQVPPERLVRIPPDLEGAWDALCLLASDDPWGDPTPSRGAIVIADDIDALIGGFPSEYAQAAGERLDRLVRMAPARGIRVVASAQRLMGVVSRIADGLPRRAILQTGSRIDHIAAGGDARDVLPDRPGRSLLDGRVMQWAHVAPPSPVAARAPRTWEPGDGVTGVVVRAGARGSFAGLLAERGIASRTVDEIAARTEPLTPGVVVGDPDAWLRNWRALGEVRGEHDLLIDASCAGEYRAITADRELPPYCAPGRGRAWLIRPGQSPQRVVLPRPSHRDAGHVHDAV